MAQRDRLGVRLERLLRGGNRHAVGALRARCRAALFRRRRECPGRPPQALFPRAAHQARTTAATTSFFILATTIVVIATTIVIVATIAFSAAFFAEYSYYRYCCYE